MDLLLTVLCVVQFGGYNSTSFIQIYQLTQSHHLNLFPKLTRRLKKGSRNSNSWVCHKSRFYHQIHIGSTAMISFSVI
ncbi:hypothetical protein RclHR1_09000001 [Rhizophagus clarus]|uniref:Uncharacterized protein n=1 Tax=Rhizophagus clarus TaxID=94130 RepID=A0A2Z6S2Z1_9GLOM|nr:hypothetical protein RclHR1_09000001 [Rhizophagus clarus]